ncbi:lipopolysaccharide-induced tumor necrosis factor-alpha factor homolog isoform X1 [Anastrepha obliqua]|uniref:lipopolysaccharide-induced tumor necrosis factor-alpha factor homolog isoform X1 n=1 Tax=Anastrepha obliqua TaxID=95512 RepID=UPI002409E2FE|nr:lipopolysaccharide-induced tumor necrosis factor-alpha factor homolog isoform X1 [Anastrepha obliqua]
MSYDNKGNPPPYSAPPPGFQPAAYYQPPPPQPMPPPPQPQTSTVIITTSRPTVMPLSEDPTRTTCPSCHADILTTVKYQPNSCTHIWALVLCLFICWPCVCVPYCMNSCQNANHYCPNCNAFIGSYRN